MTAMNKDIGSESENIWLGRLSNLNVARTKERGLAPHKPLLLLVVIDLIEAGHFSTPSVELTPALAQRFRDYWELVYERQRNRPDIRMPFHALGGSRDAVWQRYTSGGDVSVAKATTRRCELDLSLWTLLDQSRFRQLVRERLVTLYFTPKERVLLSAKLGLPLPDDFHIDGLRKDAYQFKKSQTRGRDNRFKSDVLTGYYHTCALTGYRLDTLDFTLVEAAHIHQHSESGNDDPSNGLALTPNAHILFDQGLWTLEPKNIVSGEWEVRIAKNSFVESFQRSARSRIDFGSIDRTPLVFHPKSRLRPDPDACAWHRSERFVG